MSQNIISLLDDINILYNRKMNIGNLVEILDGKNIDEGKNHINNNKTNLKIQPENIKPIQQVLSQDCAECMSQKAAKMVMNIDLQFNYDNKIGDLQIDLGPAFLISPDNQKQSWYSGKNGDEFEKSLNILDKNKVYFMRTGINSGAGHWQIIFYNKNGWISYSTETNNFKITENGKLTDRGKGLLVPYATWGTEAGQYSYLVVEASKQNIINASNFIYDFRTIGEDDAILKAFDNNTQFNKKIIKTI